MLRSALPPHIIVIIFIRLENRHVLFCVAILTHLTTHVNVSFYIVLGATIHNCILCLTPRVRNNLNNYILISVNRLKLFYRLFIFVFL